MAYFARDSAPDDASPDTDLSHFWAGPVSADSLALSFAAPRADAVVLKRLGPPGFVADPAAFQRATERLYRAVSRRAIVLALGEE